ncbi:MAG TPA: DUF885 domain-containing protein [Gemmataceae bacterium]|nr:DUF885 domain-containing protein [Gemmataceae bacterium]
MCRLVCSLLMTLALTSRAAAVDEDARLAAFFKEYLEEFLKHAPLDASRLGDHRYDDRLDDLSPKARAENVQRQRDTLARLPKEITIGKLSAEGKVDYQILRDALTRDVWLAENTNRFADDPRVWNEYTTDSVFLILTQSTVRKPLAVRDAASRIGDVPRLLLTAKESLGNPPRVFVETAIKQNRGAIAFYEQGIFEITGETPGVSALAGPCKSAVAALKEYQKFLEDQLLPRAKGEWRIGKERFAKKFELELGAGVTATEVLREAESEAERVRGEMYVVARQLWPKLFEKKPLPPDDPAGQRECVKKVMGELGKDHGEVDTLVADVKETVDEIKEFLRSRDILRLPRPDRCTVIEMPEFQRGHTTAYLNPAPPLDPRARSFFAVSPPPKDWDDRRVKSYLEEYNHAMIKLLTIHEAYPGHYVQLEYANRHPSLIRKVLSSGTFAEGWAVYTEQMMLDQGFGDGDLSLRLHQFKWYLRAVTNAILDNRMHCANMTDDEAKKFLMDEAFQTEGEALGKIVRVKQSSAQLSTYFVGRTAFYRLRQQIGREQGGAFDLGRYHEAVLAHGTLPVKFLPDLVRERLKKPR